MYSRYRLVLLLPCHWVFSVASLKVCHNAGFIMGVFYLTQYRLINLPLLHSHIFTLNSFVPSDCFIFSDFFHFSFFGYVFISSPPSPFFKSFFLTGWTVQESNPGSGEIFLICPDRTWGSMKPSLKWVTSLFCRG